MPNKLPRFFDNHKICIICEGNEDYEYDAHFALLKTIEGKVNIFAVQINH